MNKIELTKEQREKKKKMLLDMKQELQKLEYKRKYIHIINLEICTLKTFKIILNTIKALSPYITTGIVSFIVFKYLHNTPFIKDDIDRKLAIRKEFDSRNNIRYEMQYEDFADNENKLQVFSSWKKIDDRYYEREIAVYYTDKIDVDRIEEIVLNNDLSLNSLLGTPDLVKTEKSNNLSIEEINSLPFVQAITYSQDDDKTIIVKESDMTNNQSTIAWILLNILINYLLSKTVLTSNFKNLIKYIIKVNEENPIIDIEELEKTIKLRQDNYCRLGGAGYER